MRFIASALMVASLSLLAGPASAAPLRTLVYHFEMDARGFGSGADVGSSPTGGMVMGEATSMDTAARSGKIRLDVIQAAGDGGLVVDVTESVDRTDRPMQTIRCAVYGKTMTAICDQNLTDIQTVEQGILLDYIGRNFVQPDLLDDKGHWHVVTPMTNEHLDSDFTITKSDGQLLNISIQRSERGGPNGMVEDTSGTMLYDSTLDVPKWVKISKTRRGADVAGDMNLKLDLLTDSMAKATSENSH